MVDGRPGWIVDVAQETALKRRESAQQAGLGSAFAFPIPVGGKFYGVMEFFFLREVRPPTKEFWKSRVR